MKFYIGDFNGNSSGLEFDSREEFIARLNEMIDETEKNGEDAFEVLHVSGS